MSSTALSILAGPQALSELRDRGLCADRVRVLVGASGGPKWLVLHGLDRVLFPWLLAGARAPVHTIGSSIGSWRFACLATRDPIAALDRFATAYVEQRYPPSPPASEVSRQIDGMLEVLLGQDGTAPLLAQPQLRMHIVTARFRHLGAHEGQGQKVALGLAALGNLVHRRALAAFIERVVFDAEGDPGPFAPWRTLPTRHAPLTADNLRAALLATGAIPAVMSGIVNPSGAPPGMYRDGGVADYHFSAEIDPPDGLALYPHFYPQLTPGWFDKALSWRRTRGLQRVVLIAPSPAYIAKLPGGRIPDRVDFARMTDTERIAAWHKTLALGHELGEAFAELVASNKLATVALPLA